MDLPVKFPSETEVILDDVARFRALSAAERIRSLQDILKTGSMILSRSPKAAWAEQYSEAQELQARQTTREFIARHATQSQSLV